MSLLQRCQLILTHAFSYIYSLYSCSFFTNNFNTLILPITITFQLSWPIDHLVFPISKNYQFFIQNQSESPYKNQPYRITTMASLNAMEPAAQSAQQIEQSSSSATDQTPALRRSKRLETSVSLFNTNRDLRCRKPTPPAETKARVPASPKPEKRRAPAPARRRRAPAGERPYRAPKADVIFYFGFADPTLGYVSYPLRSMASYKTFFDHAAVSWDCLLGDNESYAEDVAVMLEIGDSPIPIVVPWRCPIGFQRLVRALDRARTGRRRAVEVWIKCVRKV